MHLLESYALNCGAKIDKPFIYTSYFPLPVEKYVTFHSDEAETAKNYDYWQDVINILNAVFHNYGIRIVQIGDANHRNFGGCVRLNGQHSPNQMAYLIERSMLHFGPDGFLIHVASSFDVPLVSLYGSSYAECTKPYFGSPKKQRLFKAYERTKNKPSFSIDENPKTVNLIKPEEIAMAIFELLGIPFSSPFETVFTGKKYTSFIIEEAIPNNPAILFNPEHQVEIRADLGYDENAFGNFLAHYKKSVVVLDKPVNLNILRHFKNHVVSFVVKIVNDQQKDLVRDLLEIGKPLILISDLSPEKIQELKPTYYEFGVIHRLEPVSEEQINELKKDVDNLYYRSAKVTVSGGRYFYSHAAANRNILMREAHEYQKVIDCPEFWENLHCFTVVKKK